MDGGRFVLLTYNIKAIISAIVHFKKTSKCLVFCNRSTLQRFLSLCLTVNPPVSKQIMIQNSTGTTLSGFTLGTILIGISCLGPFCPDPFGRKPIHHTVLHSSLPQEFCDMAEEAALCLAKQGAKPLKLLYGQNALTIVPCKLYFQVEHK